MVSLTKVSSLLGQHQLLFSTSQCCFLIETLPRLATHQLDKHVEGGWFQVSTWRVGEVFQDVLKGASCSEEVVHGILEPFGGASVVPRPHLCVEPPNVEEDCSSLEGHSLLGARHSRERVIPLKVETTAPVRWEEPSLDKVKLVVILEEQSRPVPIPGWSPHGLPQVSQLCQRLVIVGPVLVVVALYQLPEHVLQLELLRLLQTEGDHRHRWLVAFLPVEALNRFSAPDLSISSLLISMFSFERLFWSFPRHVAARGSEPR